MNKSKIPSFVIIVIIVIVSFITILSAEHPTGPKVKKLGKNYVFAGETFIRMLPNEDSQEVITLRQGDKLTILSEESIVSENDGIHNFWYMVSARDKTGYLDGNSLSDVFVENDLDYDGIDDLVLIRDRTTFGRSITTKDNLPHRYEIKLFKYGDYYSESYMGFYSEITFTGYHIYENMGFYPRVKLLSLRYVKRSEELNYVPAEDFFFVYNGNVNYAFTFIPIENSCSTRLFFPNDEQGEENKVIMETTCREPKRYTKRFVYSWDKRQFTSVRY